MLRMLKGATAVVIVVMIGQVAMRASGSRAPARTSTLSPEERAIEAYNSGIDHRDKGARLEQQAAGASEKDRDKLADKARKEFASALKDFKRAADNSPKMYQAYNGMGYAYRKTGEYAKALEMYDKALALAPGFPDALEYRGEAYLALNRLDDAKKAYLELFATDTAQADLLMGAMKKWVEARRADSAGTDPAAIDAFETWIQDRGQIAQVTASMARTAHRAHW